MVLRDSRLRAAGAFARQPGQAQPQVRVAPLGDTPELPPAPASGPQLFRAPGTVAAQDFVPPPDKNSPQAIGTDFDGVSMDDELATFSSTSIPPDTDGCVGPNHFVQTINGAVAVYNKTTHARLSLVSLGTFFAAGNPVGGTSDPHVVYDRRSGRWFASVIDINNDVSNNKVILGLSQTNDPTGAWNFYALGVASATLFRDYDALGMDDNGVYIGMNNFDTSGNFASASVLALAKAPLLASGTVTGGLFNSTSVTTPQPACNVDTLAPTAPAFIFCNHIASDLAYFKITWAGATPSAGLAALAVTQFASPLDAPALGSTTNVNANSFRLFATVIRNGRLWTAHHIGVDINGVSTGTVDRNAAAWYEINVSGATPSLVQSGRVFDNAAVNPRFYYYPTVTVNGQGHAAMAFSGSSAAEFIGAYTCGRLGSDPLNTMGAVTQIKAGDGPYTVTFSGTRNRWGDYSYTSLDPTDDMTLWTIQEYAKAAGTPIGSKSQTGRWGTRIASLSAPAPTLDDPAASGAQGQTGVTVNLTGTGFYDPGAGFTRPTATLSGAGISNYNLTVSKDSVATLTFDIAANAPPGARNLTFTNPDGQTASVTDGFTVTLTPSVFSFSSATYNANENAGSLNVTVDRTGGTSGAATVDYAVSDGSAGSADYSVSGGASGTLSFADGDASKTVSISLVDDNLLEGDETVNLAISNPSVGFLGTSSAALTIADDTAKPKPGSPAATAFSGAVVIVSWTDPCGNETTFNVERKTGLGSYAEIGQMSANKSAFRDETVAPGTPYTYRIRAVNGGQFSDYSGEANITTPAKPATPAGLAALGVSTTEIKLTWTGGSAGVNDLRIERKTGGGSFAEVGRAKGSATDYLDRGLTPGTLYTYQIRAAALGAMSDYSSPADGTTLPVPDAPTALNAQATSATEIKLAWTPGAVAGAGFAIEQQNGAAWGEVARVKSTAVTYIVGKLAPGAAYNFRVRAFSGATLSGPSPEAGATTAAAPGDPTALTAKALTGRRMQLTWTPGTGTATAFSIERKSGGGGFAEVARARPGTSYIDSGVTAGVLYTYRVKAVSGGFVSGPSPEASDTAKP
jgi:hypothetical protein